MSDTTTTGRGIPDNYYERMNSFEVVFCPYCGTMNKYSLDWCGSIRGLVYCDVCGGEL